MGSLFSRSEGGYLPYFNRPSVAPQLALQNQTFLIKGQRYTLLKRLGGGAFGSVWRSVRDNGQLAAVKTIDVSGQSAGEFDPLSLMESFEKEVKIAYKMRQEINNVVTIYGFDFDARFGVALLAMELGGETLTKRIEVLHVIKDAQKRHRQHDGFSSGSGGDYIPAWERKNIWMQLVNIVLALHRNRVIHCDMKPDNLVFFGPVMKIVDLGIAQKAVLGHSASAEGIGTGFFSAPECFIRGARISTKADIWSAGAILYNMTYGQPPISGSARPPTGAYRTSSPHVDDVLRGCLQRDPSRRGNHFWLAQHRFSTNPNAL